MIWADEVHLLSKAVAPPPEKWHGRATRRPATAGAT